MTSPPSATTIVICPLAFEAAPLRRALRARLGSEVRVIVSGPGRDAASKAAAAAAAGGTKRIVLAGLAGGLRDVRGPIVAHKVVDASGRSWACPSTSERAGPQWATILALDSPLFSPIEKAAWRERTGAAVVDTESHGFAAACTAAAAAGWSGTWSIVRAVSDTGDESLPRQSEHWIDAAGRTRVARVMLDVARRPRLLPSVMRLGMRSGSALRSVAHTLERLLV